MRRMLDTDDGYWRALLNRVQPAALRSVTPVTGCVTHRAATLSSASVRRAGFRYRRADRTSRRLPFSSTDDRNVPNRVLFGIENGSDGVVEQSAHVSFREARVLFQRQFVTITPGANDRGEDCAEPAACRPSHTRRTARANRAAS